MQKVDRDVVQNFSSAMSLLQSLIATRQLLKDALGTEAVAKAFELVGNAATNDQDNERLDATALLGKAAEISKPVAALVVPILKDSLKLPLPRLNAWGTADDRYYLAKAVSVSDAAWIPHYAAVELGAADVAERKSREVWAEIAINRAENLARALDLIAGALATQSNSNPTDNTSRKLNRVISAIQDFLPMADVEIGDEFGKALSRLIVESSGPAGPEDRQLRLETAQNFLDLVTNVLRLRFRASLDSEVYSAPGTILRWWRPSSPPNEVTSKAERIARIAMDSLHTLARQGVSQKKLRQALVSAFGAELINQIGSDITDKDPSLDPDIAFWLSKGRSADEAKSNTAVRELTETEFDELVARLLICNDSQEGGPQSLSMLTEQMEILEPNFASVIRAAVLRGNLISQWSNAIGAKRNLTLSGKRGDVVRFDAGLHYCSEALEQFAPARVKSPAVLKQEAGRPPRVVLKSQVEKA